MAIYTLQSRVSRALDFFYEDSIYWGIGGQTPWPVVNGIESPELPGIEDTISDVMVYKRNKTKYMVRPKKDSETTDKCVLYRGSYWKIIEPEEAYTEKARWVYLSTSFEYSEVSTIATYRKLGIYTGCHPSVTTDVVNPADMADPGYLEILDYRRPVYRSNDQQEVLNLILEF